MTHKTIHGRLRDCVDRINWIGGSGLDARSEFRISFRILVEPEM
jgi:hypothetical protein